jgi:hypothetical protein
MNKKATTLALLVGLVTLISINATTYKVKSLEPVIYNSFGDKVMDELQEGLEKFKGEYPKLTLSNDKFYVNFSECNGEKTIMISYLYCEDCALAKLVNSTNRFMKVSNRLSLPVVFDVDLHHSDIFASPNGETRIIPSSKGYAVSIDATGEVTFANFIEK